MSVQADWKHDSLGILERGARLWYNAGPGDEWHFATLHAVDGDDCHILVSSPEGCHQQEAIRVPRGRLLPANPVVLEGEADLTRLSFLNVPAVLHGLRVRFGADNIYTHAGPVLVALNPFKPVPLYSAQIAEQYRAAGKKGKMAAQMPPHVFATVDAAYRALCAAGRSQSLVISGESGSGKTETTKIAMQYLAGLAGGTGVEGAVLATNPLLEAFGNAKTARNNNSSRFGKLLDIAFDGNRCIASAAIQTYLLEKSRVVHQLPGERSYHIFYQMCRGLSDEEATTLRMPAIGHSGFAYLAQSGCAEIPGVDDAANFGSVKAAMAAVHIGPAEQAQVWRLLAGILWLGNVEFFSEGPDDSAAVVTGVALNTAAELLGVSVGALELAMSQRTLTAGGETIQRRLRVDAAVDARDAVAKGLYAGLFAWLVARVNAALASGAGAACEPRLSILDIYGFEAFACNSFEQLCINYANERLQQQFNRHLFHLEQAVYEEEGVDWEHVAFEDNQAIVDVLDARPPRPPGVLPLLDEACVFPQSTDDTFGEKLRENIGDNPCFSVDPLGGCASFTLQHYAGRVTYSCARFLDKNRDTVSPDLLAVLAGSKAGLVAELAAGQAGWPAARGGTVGARFREQLRDLVARLDRTQLHFVRCIKPNGGAKAGRFDGPLVLAQLRCCGVTEVTRIARAGYPTRLALDFFAQRYGPLLGDAAKGLTDARAVCTALLAHFAVPAALVQLGRTKVFLRAGVLGRLEASWLRISWAVLVVQAARRMAVARRTFMALRSATLMIQAAARGLLVRRHAAEARLVRAAARRIRAALRAWADRRRYLRVLAAAAALQMGLRRWQLARRCVARRERRWAREAAARVAAAEAAEVAAAAEAAARKRAASMPARVPEQQAPANRLSAVAPGPAAQDLAAGVAAAACAEYGVAPANLSAILAQWRRGGSVFPSTMTTEAPGSTAPSSARSPDGAAGPVPGNSISSHPSVSGSPLSPPSSGTATTSTAQWEEYVDDMEAQMRRLLADNAHLQAALADIRALIHHGATGPGPSSEGEAWALPAVRTPLLAEAASPRSAAALAHPALQGNGRSMSTNSASYVTEAYLAPLEEELERKARVFADDAAFIAEVATGAAQARGMDPDDELRRLGRRFESFRRDFKARLDVTGDVLKRVSKAQRTAARRTRRLSTGSGAGSEDGGASEGRAGDLAVRAKTKLASVMSRLSFRNTYLQL